MPLYHPFIEIVVFVEQAAQIAQSGQYEEARKEADAHHEALQFIGPFAICFHYSAYAKQRNETGQQKEGSNWQIYAKRYDEKHAQRVGVQLANKAHARQNVTWNNKNERKSLERHPFFSGAQQKKHFKV